MSSIVSAPSRDQVFAEFAALRAEIKEQTSVPINQLSADQILERLRRMDEWEHQLDQVGEQLLALLHGRERRHSPAPS